MGFMEKVVAGLATKYGVVTEGRHTGAEVALGNDPNQKVSVADSFEQVLFVKDKEEQGRYTIAGDIEAVDFLGDNAEGLQVKICYNDGNYSLFTLIYVQEDDFKKSLVKSLLGQKTAVTDEQKKAQKYRRIAVFTMCMERKLTTAYKEFYIDMAEKNNLYDEETLKKIKEAFGVK